MGLTRNSLTMVSQVFRDRTQSITLDTPKGGDDSQSNGLPPGKPLEEDPLPENPLVKAEDNRMLMAPYGMIDEESLNLSCHKISEKSPSMEISFVLDQSYIK